MGTPTNPWSASLDLKVTFDAEQADREWAKIKFLKLSVFAKKHIIWVRWFRSTGSKPTLRRPSRWTRGLRRKPNKVSNFLGLASYRRRYASGFVDIAAPMCHLLEKQRFSGQINVTKSPTVYEWNYVQRPLRIHQRTKRSSFWILIPVHLPLRLCCFR